MDNNALSNKIKSPVLVVVALLAMGLVVLGIVSKTNKRNGVVVELRAAPKQATMVVDGKAVGKNTKLTAGEHTAVVSHEGFVSYTKTFELRPGDEKFVLTAALSPETTTAKAIATEQRELYAEIESLSGQQSQEASELFFKNNPILRNIPEKTSYYSIDYGKDESGELIIQISASQPVGRQVALAKIRSWGYDPTDYKIVFVGLNNPFPKAVE